ncbi:MAG: metal-sensitive transcriptional regulator [Clostridia bacterium]|nr:metal-sensitive transcriptional regulator [Clostridia bacterium]
MEKTEKVKKVKKVKKTSKAKSATKKKTLKEIKEQRAKEAIEAFKAQKETIGTEEERKEIVNRLKRIIGSMNGVKKMIEDGYPCDQILIQFSAIDRATKSLANYVVLKHMTNYVVDEIKNGNIEQPLKNVVDYFKRFE